MPSAIAPLETSNTCCPRARRSAICFAQRAIASCARPRPSLVTRLDPTLTTTRRAPVMTGARAADVLMPHSFRQGREPHVGPSGRITGGATHRVPRGKVLHGEGEFAAACAAHGGNGEHG